MKRWFFMFVTLVAVFAAAFANAAPAAANGGSHGDPGQAAKQDNKPDPFTTRQLELRQKGLEAKLNGKAYGKTHEVARGQFVELEREGEDMVWTVLGEFSDLKHNMIPAPDRAHDNSTLWVEDFSSAYFNDLLYGSAPGANSMRNYYIEQSSGRYAVKGAATEWIEVPGTAVSYDDVPDANVWNFLQDSINGWYASQIAAGQTPEQINAYLAAFDVQDRYDYDGDNNFNEPDGYIDHFQSIHAGEGEEGNGAPWTIWSHSWYAHYDLEGLAGPEFNPLGGIRIGDSDYWVGKYTIQPENGGVGVFVHEYAHDLGIPDLYDTTNEGENSTGFWTLMSSGSWLSDGTVDIGSKPGHLGAWEKFQLGWLNYNVGYAGRTGSFKLGPAETNTRQAQGLFVILPKKEVVTDLGAPFAGEKFYYSGAGDDLDQFLYKPVTLGDASKLTAKVRYSIELDWDYAYVVVSTDNGATWQSVPTNLSTDTSPNGQNKGYGITGSSDGEWVDLEANLAGFTGPVLLGFRYWTDEAMTMDGLMVDEISLDGGPADGAEADEGWTLDGFRVTTGIENKLYDNYYLAEFRQYRGYDADLKYAYNFGWSNDEFDFNKVEFFPYQDGLLISYWDTSMADNNTNDYIDEEGVAYGHPGQGLLLPIDAHPGLLYRPDTGEPMRNRIQTFDATFSLEPTDGFTLHFNGQPKKIASQKAVKLFDDRKQYYNPDNPTGGVINPHTGTIIEIRSYSALDNFLQVQVRPAK